MVQRGVLAFGRGSRTVSILTCTNYLHGMTRKISTTKCATFWMSFSASRAAGLLISSTSGHGPIRRRMLCTAGGPMARLTTTISAACRTFAPALDDIQKNLKIPVSLYINATLCNRFLPIAQKLGPADVMTLADGTVRIPYRNTYRMCHATKELDRLPEKLYPRVYRETGAPILYVDEVASAGKNAIRRTMATKCVEYQSG